MRRARLSSCVYCLVLSGILGSIAGSAAEERSYFPGRVSSDAVPALPSPVVLAAAKADRRKRAQVGIASWYGGRHQGRLTASGEVFDENLLTAAHRTLPLHTRARVTNLENGCSVIVRVNDRGPYVQGRVIDLSARAAEALHMTQKGLALVRIDVLAGEGSRAAIEREPAARSAPSPS